MSTRTLVFILLATVVMLIASFLQNLYFPVVPPQENPAADVAALADADESLSSDETTVDQDFFAEEPATKTDANVDDKKTPRDNEVANDADDSDDPDPKTEPQTDPPPELELPSLYTLGSVSAESDHRYLITFSANGGTVRRIELNYRKKKGELRYRDLEYLGGYLGELDCVTTPLGCEIRVVGDGTPAKQAGLQPGDIIKSLDGEPVTTAEDFSLMMSRTRPGKTIELAYLRGDDATELNTQIQLTDKPIELIRPEPDFFEDGMTGKPSFQTSLLATTPLREVWPVLDPSMTSSTWTVDSHTDTQIVFSHTISSEKLKANQELQQAQISIAGPIKITKTYTLVPVSGNSIHEEGQRDFHFGLQIEIQNLSQQEQSLTYQLNGPQGTPTETWWYQNKIHGRNTAIGYMAGARDVVGSTAQDEFTFFGGPEIVTNFEKTAPDNLWLLNKPGEASEEQAVNYLSVDTQYFNVALLPVAASNPYTAYSVLADVADGGATIPTNKREQRLVDVSFKLFKNIKLAAGETYSQSFEIFAGPKEQEILAPYGLDGVRSFGWFAMFSKPLVWLLKLFYNLTGQMGYGIPIILLTVLVRCCMIPISRRAALNAQMMQYLQPQMKEIADKYKDDMEKRSQAQRNLFKRYNYNPFGGCFMMFLQIPIFIGLYRGLSVDIHLRDQPLFPFLNWCTNLSAPDQFWYWKDSLPGFMSFLTDESGWLGPYFNILPIITCVLFIVQQKLFTPPPTDEQQEMMQKVMKYAMVFMGFLFFKVPAGLCLYFITSSLWGIIERKMLPKPELDKGKLDDLLDDQEPDKATIKKLEKQKMREEKVEQQRQGDLEEKKRRDKERKKKLKKRGA